MSLYQFLYRYEDHDYAGLGVRVELYKFPIVSETKCGYWIDRYGQRKWVSARSRKRFAYPHISMAKESFKIRKERQLRIYENRALRAKTALLMCSNLPIVACNQEAIFA